MAKRMLQSARDIPQFSISRDLDGEQLTALRARMNAGVTGAEQKISMTALLAWLTARVLLQHPRLNSRFEDDAVVQPQRVNLGVAMDTPYGLVVPVIHAAETLSILDIARVLKELAGRAAARRLSMVDFADATFTISNLGMMGVTSFVPLVNPPQSAILGVAGPRAAVQIDADGRLVPARVIEVTVSADHRILDGAEVARFLTSLAESINRAPTDPSLGE